MAIRLGTGLIGAMRLGATEVTKAYLGAGEVYSVASGASPQAIIGNGTNYLVIPDAAVWQVTSGFTIGLWVKTNSTAQGRNPEGWFSQSSNSNRAWTVHTVSTIDTRIYSVISNDGTAQELLNPLITSFGGQTWKHITVQYNPTGPVFRGKLNNGSWVNSTVVPTFTSIFNSTADVRIGANNNAIEPIRSYTKLSHIAFAASVLSDSDVTAMYNARDAASMPAGVDVYFDFSDFNGTTTTSQIGGQVATVNASSLSYDGDVP